MVLAATGLFALIAYAVARRTSKSAFRMSLGARPAQVLCREKRRLASSEKTENISGSVITLATGHVLSRHPHDPATYVASLAPMIAVALLACWASRRARRSH